MDREHIVFISTAWEWEAGDAVIHHGLLQVLPELSEYDIYHSDYFLVNHDALKNDPAKLEELIRTAKYVIVPGTPSWVNVSHRLAWGMCMKHKKRIALLGVGLAVPYDGDFWYGREDFTKLKDSQLIDLIVCRDRHCYYWLSQRCGFDARKIVTLPCPAYYMFPPRTVTGKKNVVFAVANIEEVSHSTPTTFRSYYERVQHIVSHVRGSGANVYFAHHRHIDDQHPFYIMFKSKFPNETLHRFDTAEAYVDFHKDKDVYIGVRNHGALPCAGSGMPSLLLGTDYRQYLAEEIPFMSKIDISYANWDPAFVVDWYKALHAESISKSLTSWRKYSYDRWRSVLKPVIEVLQ